MTLIQSRKHLSCKFSFSNSQIIDIFILSKGDEKKDSLSSAVSLVALGAVVTGVRQHYPSRILAFFKNFRFDKLELTVRFVQFNTEQVPHLISGNR